MAHNMDDLFRTDLMAKGWAIQDRMFIGASGQERWCRFVVGESAAKIWWPPEFIHEMSDAIVDAKRAGQDRVVVGADGQYPGIAFDLTNLTLSEDFRGRNEV